MPDSCIHLSSELYISHSINLRSYKILIQSFTSDLVLHVWFSYTRRFSVVNALFNYTYHMPSLSPDSVIHAWFMIKINLRTYSCFIQLDIADAVIKTWFKHESLILVYMSDSVIKLWSSGTYLFSVIHISSKNTCISYIWIVHIRWWPHFGIVNTLE